MIWRQIILIGSGDLVKLGSKRKWVPMWLWLNVVFRLGLYEIQPFRYATFQSSQSNQFDNGPRN